MITCIHARPLITVPAPVRCLDCEELAALRSLERLIREEAAYHRRGCACAECRQLDALDAIRAAKGIGALGHAETRDLEASARAARTPATCDGDASVVQPEKGVKG